MIATDAQIAAGTSVDNFEKNYKAVQRYLTEDISGVNNWVKDMIDAGYALETATGFEFNVDNMEQFAAAMGRSAEFAEYMLMSLKDAGYEIDLSVLADEFANDFQSIDYMASDAGLQVKALVDEMTELANTGIDVSSGAEAAAQALEQLSETDPNFDATDLINQLNEIGNYSGFHIDPKTFEVSYKNATKDIEDYAKDHPVELEVKASDIGLKGEETIRKFVGDNAERDLATYKRALETVQDAQKNNTESLDGYIDKINEFSQEDFDNIIFGNGALEEGSAGQLETTIDGLISSLGLSQQEAIGLMQVLHDMGLIDIEPEIEVDDDEVDSAKKKVEELNAEVEKPVEKKINASVETGTPEVQSTAAHSTTAHMVTDSGTGNAKAGATAVHNQEIVQTVKTVLASGSITPEELKAMSEIQLNDQFAEYDVEVKGEEDLELVQNTIDSISGSDGFDFVVKIDQSQFETLTSSEKETNVTVNTSEANSAIDDLNAKLESIPDGEADVNVHTADALTKIGNVRNKLNELSGMAVAPSVTVADGASSVLSGISSMLTSLNGRKATTIIETQHVTTRVSNAGGHVI